MDRKKITRTSYTEMISAVGFAIISLRPKLKEYESRGYRLVTERNEINMAHAFTLYKGDVKLYHVTSDVFTVTWSVNPSSGVSERKVCQILSHMLSVVAMDDYISDATELVIV